MKKILLAITLLTATFTTNTFANTLEHKPMLNEAMAVQLSALATVQKQNLRIEVQQQAQSAIQSQGKKYGVKPLLLAQTERNTTTKQADTE